MVLGTVVPKNDEKVARLSLNPVNICCFGDRCAKKYTKSGTALLLESCCDEEQPVTMQHEPHSETGQQVPAEAV